MSPDAIRAIVAAVLEHMPHQVAAERHVMTPEDIRTIVAAVLEEESVRRGAALDEVVFKAVATILTSFGIEEEDRKELTLDLNHLRRWRKSVEQAQSMGFKLVFGAIISGLVGALWMGVKASIKQ
jgi:uncharacterized protein (UPF0371 family)